MLFRMLSCDLREIRLLVAQALFMIPNAFQKSPNPSFELFLGQPGADGSTAELVVLQGQRRLAIGVFDYVREARLRSFPLACLRHAIKLLFGCSHNFCQTGLLLAGRDWPLPGSRDVDAKDRREPMPPDYAPMAPRLTG